MTDNQETCDRCGEEKIAKGHSGTGSGREGTSEPVLVCPNPDCPGDAQ